MFLKKDIFLRLIIPAQTWKSHSGDHISTGLCCESAKTYKKQNINYNDTIKDLQMSIPAWRPNP